MFCTSSILCKMYFTLIVEVPIRFNNDDLIVMHSYVA